MSLRLGRGRDEAVEQHVVGRERVGLAGCEHRERLRVVGRGDDLDAELLLVGERAQRRLVGRAGGDDDGLAGEIAVGPRRRGSSAPSAWCRRRRRSARTPPPSGAGRCSVVEPHSRSISPAHHLREAVRRVTGAKAISISMPSSSVDDLLDDLAAEIDRIADRLLPAG